ncbi:hypothetical protein RRF57_001466 [Xylaria bambusicola]|uniref:Calcineurin-like phosphoesterase domain-containing protein n=1 Tax=Xylaria bambusicola TaxID=326684 RepID=A0AAN7U5I4_9PEZI
MPNLQIISDIHLESPRTYDIFEIIPKAPHLALSGDVGYVFHKQEYFDFLRRYLLKFQTIFLVLGNHEPWHSTWDVTKEAIRDFERQISQERQSSTSLGKFVLLDRTIYHLEAETGESIAVIGCTLFSQVPAQSIEAVSFGVNNFYQTENWTVEDHNAMFEGDLKWLNEQVLSLRGNNIIVLTHYSLTLDECIIDLKYKGSLIRFGFATDLSNSAAWLSDDVIVWAFGHTHFNCDYVGERTGKRVVTNQRGYYFTQSLGFYEDKVIEI